MSGADYVQPWLTSVAEYIAGLSKELEKAEAENAKLRDIARRQHEIIITQYCTEYDSMRCKEECPLYYSKDDCEVTRIMDELGIGVE